MKRGNIPLLNKLEESLSRVPGFLNIAILFRQLYLINIYFSLLYAVIRVQLPEPSC